MAHAKKVLTYPEAKTWEINAAISPFYDFLRLPKKVVEAEKAFDTERIRQAFDAVKGFAAAAIGGLGSNRGALIAGIMIGIAEAANALWLSPGQHNAVILLLVLLVLAVLLARPGGPVSTR